MKKSLKYIFSMAILVVAMLFCGMTKSSSKGSLTINISDYVGDQILELDSVKYKNALGQDFTVTNFKYYVGNFRLINENGKEFKDKKYFLVRADDPASFDLMLKEIPEGKYISMSFTLGVDSIDNCSGAQSGALDPVNGMFWAWNTGYIFLKLEGKSSFSKSTGNTFEYHIGGYRSPNNCIRKVELDLKNNPLQVVAENHSEIFLKADAAEVLKSPTTIDFTKLSSVTDFHNATTIADNYKDMFSVLKIENAK